MRKGRDGEWKMEKKWKMENNGENSGSLTSLPVDRLMACSTATPPLVPISCKLSEPLFSFSVIKDPTLDF